jgi:hypothetical protein
MLEEMYEMLRSIGPCPDDSTGPVILTDGKKAGKIVTCEWFQKNLNRCVKYSVGEIMCNSIVVDTRNCVPNIPIMCQVPDREKQ